MALFWGGRRPSDLYLDALCRSWADSIPHFKYVPVISHALPEDQWTGRDGFVHQAAMADFPDMRSVEVYACGAPVVVNAARADFVAACQLPSDSFFADSFTNAADLLTTQA
jgi:CDP-4-dehydro-6-deoxyglucose reductase